MISPIITYGEYNYKQRKKPDGFYIHINGQEWAEMTSGNIQFIVRNKDFQPIWETYCTSYSGPKYIIRLEPNYSNGFNPEVSKEEFIEFLKEHYPDDFEWFLWNPDILNGTAK